MCLTITTALRCLAIIKIFLLSINKTIDRVERDLTEVIHVMFYTEVYLVALGPSVYLLITPAKARETYCVQSIHLRATPITESHAP